MDEKNLRQEYENIRQSIWNRSQRIWLVHSVLISGSLLIVLASFEYNEKLQTPLVPFEIPIGALFPLASLILVLFPVYLHYAYLKLNNIMFERMHEIERQLGMTGPLRMFETKIRPRLWHKLRNPLWYTMFAFLILFYLLFLISWFIS